MIKIRLARHGKTNDPFYKIVAIDERRPVKGKPLDTLGHWHPKKDELVIEKKKISEWVKKGAFVTKAVNKLISK